VPTARLTNKAIPTDPAELMKLLERAQNGDETTLPILKELVKQSDLLQAFGDLASLAQSALARRISGKDVAIREAVMHKVDALRAELAGQAPTALERLLAERIAACWLHLHHLELVYAGKDSMSLELAAYYQRSLSAAQKRYLSAIKTLATVRRLALPVLIGQVNIAGKQVNKVAMSAPDAERPGRSPCAQPMSGKEQK